VTTYNVKSENTLYRSYRPDGTLWCESWNLAEVLGQSYFVNEPLEYERVTVRTVEEVEDWEQFVPDPSAFPAPETVPGYGERVDTGA